MDESNHAPRMVCEKDASDADIGTAIVHAGSPLDPLSGAVIPSITLSTTFAHSAPGSTIGCHLYSRASNPNRDNIQRAVATLEHSRFAVAFSSGSAAVASLTLTLEQGAHMVSVADLYGGTREYFSKLAGTHGVHVTFTNNIEDELPHLIRPNQTKMIWIETPSNPTLKVVDIARIADFAHNYGIKVVVDNTFLSPYIQTPLDHGADVVVHSVTKYLNGHSDVIMGMVALNDEELNNRLCHLQVLFGAVPSPFDCWLAHRGLKTLHLRVREACENAKAVAEALEASPQVITVHYPGLASYYHRKTVLKQHREGMGGGVLSFRIKGGVDAAIRFCQSTRIFILAVSLGGVESLVEIPSKMTHARIPQADREDSDLYEDVIRLSCGIEGREDLVTDVLQALTKATTCI